jgi:uncharacterized membrane protein YhhN
MLGCSHRYPRSSRTGGPVGGKLPVNFQIGAFYPFMPYQLSALARTITTAIWAVIAMYWRARMTRLKRPPAGMGLSASFAMIASSSAVPLRHLAEMIPNSAICPRIIVR